MDERSFRPCSHTSNPNVTRWHDVDWVDSTCNCAFGFATDTKNRTQFAETERDLYRQLYHAQMLRSTELADQLRELQSLPQTALRNPKPPVALPIDLTGNRPSDPTSIVELKLSSEYVDRIRIGDIVIVGSDIVGRVIRVGLTRVEVRPSTHKDVGLIRAAIVPAHPRNENGPTLKAEVLIRSAGSGGLYAEVPTDSGVVVGDLVGEGFAEPI